MFKWLIHILFVLSLHSSFAEVPGSTDVRKGFVNATQNKTLRPEYLLEIERLAAAGDAFHKAYLGAAKTLMAEYSYTPWNKLNYFEEGKKLIEESIKKDAENPEYRYLRFLIQFNAPDFLGYSSNLKADYEFIERYLDTVEQNPEWAQYYLRFVQIHANTLKAKLQSQKS